MDIEFPSELTPDTTILIVQPFDDDECDILSDDLTSDDEIEDIFRRAVEADPDFRKFKLAVYDISKPLGLKIYTFGNDMIMLAGEPEQLAKAADALSEQTTYSHYLDTVEGFSEYAEDSAEVSFILEPKPRLH
ncbi:MAG: hypothetical protein H6867_07360 [Rhodospirillales bacterium]|nr:hypothetical protein [Rhodospirillales bacterium]MCB9995369.1 hypothetical protein [Rhodospirillales bacterium]